MSTTLFNATPYDFAKARRRRNTLIAIVLIVVVAAVSLWWFRYWPYERKVDQFFTALQNKDYEKAYGLWVADPTWKQHPETHAKYPFGEFMTDWGPMGDWGVIKSHKVDTAIAPKGGSSGVVVQITVNERREKECLWVEKRDKSITWSPTKTLECR